MVSLISNVGVLAAHGVLAAERGSSADAPLIPALILLIVVLV